MDSRISTAALLMAAATTLAVSPAVGQTRQAGAERQTEEPEQKPQSQPEAAPGSITPSKAARQALIELQAAVNAKDSASIPAKIAAAQAVVQTPQDRYILGNMRYQVAVAAQDNAAAASAITDIMATGLVGPDKVVALNRELARARFNLKQYDQAGAALDKVLAAEPGDMDSTLMLAEIRRAQGQTQQAVQLLQKGLAQAAASGTRPNEALYKQAIALAYGARLPAAMALSRDWVRHYPSTQSWRDAIGIYNNLSKPSEDMRLAALRLARANNALNGEDYERLAYLALTRGYPAEAKAVLDAGAAAGAIDVSKGSMATLMAEAKAKAAADKVDAAEALRAGTAASTAKTAMINGDLLYGLGRYSEAAQVYKSALGKTGADSNQLNLHLGMALAQAGDKAGAEAALSAVGGNYAELAKYWQLYLATRA